MTDSTGEAGQGSTPDPTILREIDTESALARGPDPYSREPVPAGGGFMFTPAQVEYQLGRCAELIERYHAAEYTALDSTIALHPPAPDEPGSLLQADATLRCLRETAQTAKNQLDFLISWQHRLAEVKATYLRTEHLTETQWQRLARG